MQLHERAKTAELCCKITDNLTYLLHSLFVPYKLYKWR